MTLQEHVTALEAEKKYNLDMINNLTAEKIAIDQMAGESLKQIFMLKKELIISNQRLIDSQNQINILNKEKETLQKQLQELNEKLLVTE